MIPDEYSDPPEAAELQRIRTEYQSRSRRITPDFYALWREENLYAHAQIARSCARLLRKHGRLPLGDSRIADIGCGEGHWLLEFSQWGASSKHLYGIELLPERVAAAQQHVGNANLVLGNAARLPWRDGSFDLVTQFVVLSSVLDASMRSKIAAEMKRVLCPGGHILWFDTQCNNPRNPAIRGITKRDLQDLFPRCRIQSERTVLFPLLARTVARRSWLLASALETLPFLRTHLAAIITPGE